MICRISEYLKMNRIKFFLNTIIRSGIDQGPDSLRSVSKITNMVLLYVLLGSLVSIFISLRTQVPYVELGIITGTLFTITLILLILRKYGMLDVARFTAIITLNVSLYLACSYFNETAGLIGGFYIFALLPFLFFSHAEVFRRLISITIAVVFYGLTLFDIFPFTPAHMGTPQDVFLFNTFLNVVVFIGLVAIIQHYYETKQISTNQIKADQYILKEAQGIANLGNWSWDPHNDIWEWSEAVLDILGMDHETELTIDDIYGLIHPLDRSKVQNTLRNVIHEREQVRLEFTIFTAQQQERVLLMIFKPIRNDRHKLISVRGILQDVSAQKEIEINLIKAKEAAEATTRAKSEFLSTMSHEIRTPLNAVIGMAGLLAETELDPVQEDYLSTIKIGGNNLLSVINDILDYSKIESGNMELEYIDFRFSDPIDNTLDLLASKARENNLELLAMLGEDIPEFVRGDIVRIQQILVNLLNNAIKFTEEGEILVKVNCIGEWENGHILQFSVKDTGVGIPKNKIHRLFKSFSQVDASTNRKYGGTGLGLAICKRLVELMDGEIWVESEFGVGTTFTFTIKTYISEKKPEEGTKAKGVVPQKLKGNILIVDDNETNLKILQKNCQTMGLEVLSALDGNAGWEILEKQPGIDLVITDFHMPGLTGIELARKSREELKDKCPPFILLSSVANLPEESKGDLFKAAITKPIRRTQLREAIGDILGKKRKKIPAPKASGTEISFSLGREVRILVAEDNPINQKVIKRMMGKLSLEADLAATGLEVLEAVEKKTYDVIFMDMQMPEMDGLQATRELRKIPEEKLPQQPVIIALTANAMESEKRDCFDAGMNDFLAKPIRWELLAKTLEKWFGKDGINPGVNNTDLVPSQESLAD